MLPEGFYYIDHPNIKIDLAFYGKKNIIGKRLTGYNNNVGIMRREACVALYNVADELKKEGYGLIVYDAYRPESAQNYLHDVWQNEPGLEQQKQYYPGLGKVTLFNDYLADDFSHNSGNSVAVALSYGWPRRMVDMGGSYGVYTTDVAFRANLAEAVEFSRAKLRKCMKKNNFYNRFTVWWKFEYRAPDVTNSLEQERKENTYDFPIEKDRRCCRCWWRLFTRTGLPTQAIQMAFNPIMEKNKEVAIYDRIDDIDTEHHADSASVSSDSSFEPVV